MTQLREISIIDGIGFVPLTKGKSAMVDINDVPLVSSANWFAMGSGSGPGVYAACHKHGTRSTQIRMHWVIMSPPIEMVVDHISGDTLDNRRSNLRVVTPAQNKINRAINANNCSGVKGVHWCRTKLRWMAYIGLNGTRHALGAFVSFEDALACRKAAERKLHGEFARAA